MNTTRTEWAVRIPTKHFGIQYEIAKDEASARRSIELLHDVEHVLNANPDARLVCRTVTESEWEERA